MKCLFTLTLLLFILHFNKPVFAQWNADPNVNNAIVNGANYESIRDVCSDGAGGTIFVYVVESSPSAVLRVQRIDASGNKLWGANGVEIVTVNIGVGISPVIQPVSGGGAIVSFITLIAPAINTDVFAQRIDAAGAKLWNAGNPVVVCNATGGQLNVKLAVFPDASSVMTWEDQRPIAGGDGRSNIFAQNLNASGAVQWVTNGVIVSLAVQDQLYPQILPVNNGGNNESIIVWEDYRTDPQNPDIYGQRLDANGVRQWPGGGVTGAIICNSPGPQLRPLICTDGGTGAIVAWRDGRIAGFFDIASVRIDINGVSDTDWWAINGISVTQSGTVSSLNNLEFVDNKIVYVWNILVPASGANYDLKATALDIEATYLWGTTQDPIINVSDAPLGQENSQMQPDGAGGVIIVWLDRRVSLANYRHVYAQRLSATGVPQWTATGKAVATINQVKQNAFVTTNGCTSIFIWDDWRTSGSTSVDIYATSFDCNGNVSTAGGAAVGDYRSNGTGSWNSAASWQRFDGTNWVAASAAPSSTDGVISILNGHTITANTTITADQVVVDAGGTLSIILDVAFTLNNGTGDDLTVNGTLSYTRGEIGGSGNIIINTGGVMNLLEGFFKILSNPITNNGTFNWQDGIVFYNASTTITNNGTFNISGTVNRTWQSNAGTCTFINNGTITNSNSGTTTFSVNPFTNAGTINFNAGTLQNNSPVWNNTDNLTFSNGAIFNLSAGGGTFNLNTGSLVTGTGTVNNTQTINLNTDLVLPASMNLLNTSTIQGAGNLTVNRNFTIEGTIEGTGALNLNGTTNTWISGTIARPLIVAAGQTLNLTEGFFKGLSTSLTNNGTINWQDGVVLHNTSNTVTNNGRINITGTVNRSWNSNSAAFINNAIITNLNTGTTTFVANTFTNNSTGTIEGVSTIVMNASTFNSNGIIAPGATIGLLTLNTAQPFSANSTLQIQMLNATGPGTGNDQLLRDGNLTLAGTLTVSELGTVPNGSYTIISLTSGTISGNFSATNLPAGYALQVNATTVALIKNVALPLTFISFNGTITNNTVVLKWITENEINTSHFEIERSLDGNNFINIGTVNSVNQQGTNNYAYTDAQSVSGNNFYRLKQIDKDGRFTYSNILKMQLNSTPVFAIYPNPVTDVLNISGAKPGSVITIYDAAGKQLLRREITAQSLIINMGSYAHGMYLLIYKIDGKTNVQRIIKH